MRTFCLLGAVMGGLMAATPSSAQYVANASSRTSNCTFGTPGCSFFSGPLVPQDTVNEPAYVRNTDGAAFDFMAKVDAPTGFGVLPDLHAYAYTAAGAIQSGYARAHVFQKFRWNGDQALTEFDIVGLYDYTRTHDGGIAAVSGGIAVIANAPIADIFSTFIGTTIVDQFAANCTSTPLAYSVANAYSGFGAPTGPEQGALDVDSNICGGNFSGIQPGETFYIWSRVMALSSGGGTADAFNTLSVVFDPSVSAERRAYLQANLEAITGTVVPEPASWALMIGGFGLMGLVLRRRAVAA